MPPPVVMHAGNRRVVGDRPVRSRTRIQTRKCASRIRHDACVFLDNVFGYSPHVRVYLAAQPIDMRAGHDSLFAIVKSWDLNPFSGDLF